MPDTGTIRSVAFSFDGRAVRTEAAAAYDLGGTASDGSGQAYRVGTGSHTVQAVVTRRDGTTATVTAPFTVR